MASPKEMVAAFRSPPHFLQWGSAFPFLDAPQHIHQGQPVVAFKAFGKFDRAVQFNDAIFCIAGRVVQAVDILRDYARQFAELFQLDDGVVGGIRLVVGGDQFLAQLPVPPAGLRIGYELLDGEIRRVVPGPDTVGTSEIGNARFRADPGAGKNRHSVSLPDESGRRCDKILHGHLPVMGLHSKSLERTFRRYQKFLFPLND